MKLSLTLSALALLAVTAVVRGDEGGGCSTCKGPRCNTPEPFCPDCSGPCEHRLNLAILGGGEHVQKLLDQLCTGCCCERIHAAKKLGSRLHADVCCNPEVATALVKALQCDTCWEVRKAAAWALAYQGARTRMGVLGLYLASKLDPHWMVRQAATEALDVMLVCRRDCYKDLFAAGDALARKLAGKYKPTGGSCVELTEECLALAGESAIPPQVMAAPTVETVPAPKAEKPK